MGKCKKVYVYLGQEGHRPSRVAAFNARDEAKGFIRQHAADSQGNLMSPPVWNTPYLYLADPKGRPLEQPE